MSQLACDKNTNTSPETFDDLEAYGEKSRRSRKSVLGVSHREKSARILGSVSKELSGKAFTKDLQNFKIAGGLQTREIICDPLKVSLRFSSPLDGISSPYHIKRFRCEDLISELSNSSHQDKANSPSVTAVKLNWRRGIRVEQVSAYSRSTKMIEPEMNTVDFDFESKMKFQKAFQATADLLFPNKDVMILDGNECHGQAVKSQSVQQDNNTKDDSHQDAALDGKISTFTDVDEHQILLVPFNSKTGFDHDVSKRYRFPYHAKFTIGKKAFEHKFDLRLTLSPAPQHYGLIFSFPDDSSKILHIKSLLTVFSVFPSSPRHAKLSTYQTEPLSGSRPGGNKSKRSLAGNLSSVVSTNLREENAVIGRSDGGIFSINCQIAHPNHSKSRGTGPVLTDAERKQKIKQSILRNIHADARET